MVRKVLTAMSVERLKADPARRQEIADAALPGLYLIIQPSGVKSFAVRYRLGAKTAKFTLGSYPRLDLAAARDHGRRALQLASQGINPLAEKQARIVATAARATDTIDAAIDLYVERHLKSRRKVRYAQEAEALLRNHILPRWTGRRIAEITRKDVVKLSDDLVSSGMTAGANRVVGAGRTLFNFALERELITTTPFAGVRKPHLEISRDRVLSDAECALIWRAAEKVGFPFGPMVQMLMLTAARRDEVAKMVRGEIDGDVWIIPGARTKNSREHAVPLSEEARDILASVPAIAGKPGYVFTRNGEAPISDYSKSKARLDKAMLAISREADPDAAVVEWRLHDLRRTAASGIARLGFPVHIVEAVLNHRSGSLGGVAGVYNRYQYLSEKAEALQVWGRHIARSVRDPRSKA